MNRQYQHKSTKGSVGFFIPPEGMLFRAEGGNHVSTVIANPSKFGLTMEQVQHVYDFFGEKIGVEGSARQQILTHLIQQGWIRLRRYPNKHWSVNINKLTRQSADLLEDWASKFLAGFAVFLEPDPHMPVSITECLRNVSRLSIKEVSDGALRCAGKYSSDAKRFRIRFLENAALLPDIPPASGSVNALEPQVWKYYIPHVWDKPRQSWEDLYLLPCDPSYRGDSIWLTIDALGDGQGTVDMFHGEDFKRLEKELEGRDYVIKGTDMTVRGRAFIKREFLKWIKVWLEENGFEVDELVEAPFEDFEGTNQQKLSQNSSGP